MVSNSISEKFLNSKMYNWIQIKLVQSKPLCSKKRFHYSEKEYFTDGLLQSRFLKFLKVAFLMSCMYS